MFTTINTECHTVGIFNHSPPAYSAFWGTGEQKIWSLLIHIRSSFYYWRNHYSDDWEWRRGSSSFYIQIPYNLLGSAHTMESWGNNCSNTNIWRSELLPGVGREITNNKVMITISYSLVFSQESSVLSMRYINHRKSMSNIRTPFFPQASPSIASSNGNREFWWNWVLKA